MKSISLFFILWHLLLLDLQASEVVVDPRVNGVLRSYDLLNKAGDFYRAILTNTELESCLIIDKVNLRDEKRGPKVLENLKYCSFKLKNKDYSLLPDKHQEVEIVELAWKKSKLNFTMNYMSTEKSAALWELSCVIDPKKSKKEFSCEAI